MDTNAAVLAAPLKRLLRSGELPSPGEWAVAQPIRFDADWQGRNSDPLVSTEVRLLWSVEILCLHFHCRYKTISVFPDSEPSGRRDQMWDRDVAEAFLQPDGSDPKRYKEFEISPAGQWIDLDIGPGIKNDLNSDLWRSARIDEAAKVWKGQLAIPVRCLTDRFDPATEWRANFYRVEGPAEPRFYSAWSPTGTPQPQFHVPAAFRKLIFAR